VSKDESEVQQDLQIEGKYFDTNLMVNKSGA